VTQAADEVTAEFGMGMDIGVEFKGITVKVRGRSPVEGVSPEKEIATGPHCAMLANENMNLERTTCGPKARTASGTSMADEI
jgi:hypothetical protein